MGGEGGGGQEAHTSAGALALVSSEFYSQSNLSFKKGSSTVVLSRDFIAETILYLNEEDCIEPAFLVYSLGERYKGFHVERVVSIGNTKVKPTSPEKYPYTPYVFSWKEDLSEPDPRQLYEEVLDEFRRFVDIEDEIRVLMASAVMLTYIQEDFETVPYIYLLGDNESGKTHTLNLFAALCYRPLYGVSIPSADLYTFLGTGGHIPTIIEDEIQGVERDTEKAKIWKTGYKRGAKVPRITIKPNGERVIEYYPSYCLKIAAGEKLIRLKGLSERFIIIPMVEGEPVKDEYEKEDYERFMEIRKKLLMWRMIHLIDSLPLPKLDLPWLKKRPKELYKPLLTVTQIHPTYFQTLKEFVKRSIDEKVNERRSSFEGFLTKAIIELIGRDETFEIPTEDIWVKLKMDLDGVDHPSKPYQMDTELFGTITKQKVGRRLKEVLGSRTASKRIGGEVKRVHVFEPSKLLKAARRYYLVTDVTDVADSGQSLELQKGLEILEKTLTEASETLMSSSKSVTSVTSVTDLEGKT